MSRNNRSTSGLPQSSTDMKRRGRFSLVAFIALFTLATTPFLCIQAEESNRPTLEGIRLVPPVIPAGITGELRALNENLSKGIAPADNAAVVLTQLFSETVYDRPLRDDSFEMLGIDQLSPTAPQFTYIEPFIKSLGVTDPKEFVVRAQQLEQQIFAGSNRPWTQTDLPELHAFLTANQAALDLFRVAADKPHYYAPLITAENPPQLLTASLALERRLPFMVQVMCARALNRLATHDGTAAMDDLLSCQKLAVLLAQGSPLDVSGMKAHQMDAFANNAVLAALSSGEVRPADAKYYLAGLKKFPRLPSSSIAADRGERAILRQELELLKLDGSSVRDFFDLPDEEKFKALGELRLSELPWDLAEKRANQIQDGFVKVIAMTDRGERLKLCEQLDKDFEEWKNNGDKANRALAEAFDKDLSELTRRVGETMAMSLRPWYVQRIATDERARLRHDMVVIGMALVICRGETGQFPMTLSELAPKYLDSVPVDAHSNQPFGYGRTDNDQAKLTSLGGNQRDDAGQAFNDDRTLELKWIPDNNRPKN